MADIENFRSESAYDPPAPKADDVTITPSDDPLDSDESNKILGYIEAGWREAHEAHAENRREQMIDADFYDHIQWTLEDSTILMNRGQAPLVYNIIKPAVDWLTGTERRTRVDWRVYGRNEEDDEGSRAKTALLKYLYDVNAVGYERSRAFKDACVVGVGWLEESIRTDGDGEPIMIRYADWKEITWDPYSRRADLEDCRYVNRDRWVDEDWAVAAFPDRATKIRESAMNAFDTDSISMMEDWNGLPMVFTNLDRFGRMTRYGHLIGTTASTRRSRKRVKLIETWYRRPVSTKKIKVDQSKQNNPYQEWDSTQYDPNNEDMKKALKEGYVTLTHSVAQEIWCAIWLQGALLQNIKSPFKHGRFPFTPIFAYRRHRDGMPYGPVRGARDPQEDYNKRRSKAQFHLSTKQIYYEEDAFSEDNEDLMLEQVAMPNGQVRVAAGALKDKKIEIKEGRELAEAEIKLMENSGDMVMTIAGVTKDNTGNDSNASSGRAIIAKQQQGAVTTAELYDNFRFAFQFSGQKAISLMEQYMPEPKQIRVLGPSHSAEYLKINQPHFDGEKWMFHNDITAQEADFVVDQQDYRETVRQAMAESLFDLLSKIDPSISLQLLDLAVDMTDLPNKEELVQRIRKINGQTAPGEKLTPEMQQALQQKQQEAAQDRQLQVGTQEAKIAKDQAVANKTNAQAAKDTVEGKDMALDTAAKVGAAPHLAPAADNLYKFNGNNYDPATGNPNPAPAVLN